jgi:hypothetical protein
MDISAEYVWLGVGFALIIAEVTMGNFILFFLGLAAALTGVAMWMGLPADNGIPYMLFAALALVLLVGVRSRMKLHLVGDSVQGSADEDFVGKEVSVASGFNESSPGRGRVSYRGADWNARSEQAAFAPGDIIKITGRDGNTLFVNQETN